MASFDRSDTYSKVVDVIAEKTSVDKAIINGQSTFATIGADSLDMVEVIMKLEELFSVEIKDEDVEKLATVNDLVDYVQKLRVK